MKHEWDKAVWQYSRRWPERVETVEDLKVPGVFALRVVFCRETADYTSEHVEFYLCDTRNLRSGERVADRLEECEFTAWPPKSGQLKFFT